MVYYAALPKEKFKEVKCPSEVPRSRHFAILLMDTSSTYVPGDERSRQAPGHGYPEHYETHNDYKLFVTTDEKAWKEGIKQLYKPNYEGCKDPQRKDVLAYIVESVASVQVDVQIGVA